jgi:hypothetical protein
LSLCRLPAPTTSLPTTTVLHRKSQSLHSAHGMLPRMPCSYTADSFLSPRLHSPFSTSLENPVQPTDKSSRLQNATRVRQKLGRHGSTSRFRWPVFQCLRGFHGYQQRAVSGSSSSDLGMHCFVPCVRHAPSLEDTFGSTSSFFLLRPNASR